MALVVLGFSACAITGGDLIVRVSGRLPEVEVDDLQGVVCKMDAVSARTGESSMGKVVAANFSVPMMMVVGPEAAPYFFEVDCENGERYQSREFLIGSRQPHSNGIDVGELQKKK
ncbi:hypothetical protein [Stenotrophomonas sp. PD6]|uniref:hypothetical protein n=1 Tax=Stenotrophomonas sp. PD6 TaxID=3368612 RepID=UPI003BA255B3